MFHFCDYELGSILRSDGDNNPTYWYNVSNKIRTQYKPLFFTPYRSVAEASSELVAPFLDPLRLIGMSTVSGAAFMLFSAVCLGSALVAGVAALFKNVELRDEALNAACVMTTLMGSALITAASTLILALVSIPFGLLSLCTRSVVTVSALLPENQVKEEGSNTSLL